MGYGTVDDEGYATALPQTVSLCKVEQQQPVPWRVLVSFKKDMQMNPGHRIYGKCVFSTGKHGARLHGKVVVRRGDGTPLPCPWAMLCGHCTLFWLHLMGCSVLSHTDITWRISKMIPGPFQVPCAQPDYLSPRGLSLPIQWISTV